MCLTGGPRTAHTCSRIAFFIFFSYFFAPLHWTKAAGDDFFSFPSLPSATREKSPPLPRPLPTYDATRPTEPHDRTPSIAVPPPLLLTRSPETNSFNTRPVVPSLSSLFSALAATLEIENHNTDSRSGAKLDMIVNTLLFSRDAGFSQAQTLVLHDITLKLLTMAGDPKVDFATAEAAFQAALVAKVTAGERT